MPRKTLAIICAFFAVLADHCARAAESQAKVPLELPAPKPGEDAMIVRRNFVRNLFAEHSGGRETTVKFDDDLKTKCPTVTSLFSSTGPRLSWLTPNYSLYDARAYVDGSNADEAGATFVVENADCRYVLTVKRYDRENVDEKMIRVGEIPLVERKRFAPRPVKDGDEKFGFDEAVMPFINPLQVLNFTGIAFFAPTTFTINLANVEKNISIASESNFLTHTYTVEIKNPQAALRISINKELYSNGQWVNAYTK